MKNYKKIMSVVFLASAVGYTGVVSAHSVSGTLGKSDSGAAATDVYQVDCGALAAKVALQVNDQAPTNPSLVSVLAVKGKSASQLITDPTENGVATPEVTFAPAIGKGIYTLIVTKSPSTKKGVEKYKATIHCNLANGEHTEKTEPKQVQDQ